MARILIVDDHVPNRELIATLVRHGGHAALEAGDGAEALGIVKAERPELVICDILMPRMDGYEFVRRLRADPEIARTEVIYYTANYHEREVRELAGRLGVTRILIKPCEPDEILAAVDDALEAGVEAAAPVAPGSDFEREHLRVLTDKLAAKVAELEDHAAELSAEIGRRRRVEEQLRRVVRARRVMAEANRALVRATAEGPLLAQVCRFLAEVGGYALAWIELAGPPPGTVASAGDIAALAGLRGEGATSGASDPAAAALHGAGPQVAAGLASGPGGDAWQDAAAAHGIGAVAALPLRFDGEVVGVLGIAAKDPQAFDGDELELLGELADDVAFGMRTLRARVVQQQTEDTLRLRNRAIEESINAIVISEANAAADNPMIYANPAFTQMTGYASDEAIGRNPRFLLGDDLEQPELERLRDAVRHGLDARVTLRNYRKDGTLFWNDLSLASVPDPQGHVSHFISVFNDLTDRMRYERELERQANHDALTGLANRSLLYDRLDQAIAHARRSNGSMAVMLLDLDRFKLINDSLGHADGDALLREVAWRLADVVRRSDTVGRLGGDEFMIVMPEISSANDAATLAAKLLGTLARPVVLPTREVAVTGSLGVAVFPRDGELGTSLVKNADVAMYRAKEQGRNGFQFYSAEMNARLLERLELENALRAALGRRELELHYQPKVDLRSGGIVGVEALLRWRHPSFGLLAPDEFIPVAEESGLIVPIGEWVIETACRQVASWRAESLPQLALAVNLSPRQLHDANLPSLIARVLGETGLEAAQLHLELSESTVMGQPERTAAVLAELKRGGMRISLDDFGTGCSNLSHLRRMPFDSLKIDRSFVVDLDRSRDDAAIARMVISLAHTLGLSVIAEGVETDAQLRFLRRHRCDAMQGFVFSEPLPADDCGRLLRAGPRLNIQPARHSAGSAR